MAMSTIDAESTEDHHSQSIPDDTPDYAEIDQPDHTEIDQPDYAEIDQSSVVASKALPIFAEQQSKSTNAAPDMAQSGSSLDIMR